MYLSDNKGREKSDSKNSSNLEYKIVSINIKGNKNSAGDSLTQGEALQILNTQQYLSSQQDSATLTRKKLAHEREDVQKKTFTKWINSQLTKKNHPPITDLFYDIQDGTRLLTLLEVLTDKTFKREKGRMRVHHLNNVAKALKILEEENVKLVNISNEHIVDGSPKITLGLIWAIILHWQVQGVLKDVMSELQQTNLEKTLLAWCRQTTQSYQGVDVRNFTTSWRDGLAFCAIIHRHRPDFFEWPVMAKKHPYARLDNAFRIAQENLGIERLLDPEDVNTQNPDKKSIMMYVMCLFQSLPHSTISMDSLNISVQSDSSFSIETGESTKDRSASSISVGVGTYQQTLEEVLTWLLGAEDRLAGMADIADNTKDVKDQFHELEDLLLDLTSRQGGIGDVLSEGSRLLRENLLGEEESEEIRVQMKLLNTRWEELRIKVMARQTSLHERLMKLQQEELDTLKLWLTKTEDRIANMSEIGPTLSDLNNQITAHKSLQKDLEVEQENISSLSNMVVVEDESNSDTAYSSLEDELTALGERWAHICKWAEQRWTVLQNLRVQWSDLNKELERSQSWLNEKERFLKELESNPTEQKQEMLNQAVSLQLLQAEIENETQRRNALNDISNSILSLLPPESSAQETIPNTLEEMQDRWECLLSILEAQKQRFLASGIDINAVLSTTESYVTITTDEEGNAVKKITTKTILTENSEVLTHKRQKMTGEAQQEFNNAVLEIGTWMEHIENRLQPSITYSLPSEEMNRICNEVEEELKNHEEDYKKALSLGQSATSETATVGESTVDNEIKMTSLRTRWTGLDKSLKNLRLRINFNNDTRLYNLKLEELRKELSSLEVWINDVQSTIQFDCTIVESQIKECQAKKENVKEKEEQLTKLEKDAQTLPSLWSEEKDEVLRGVQALLFNYKNLFMRITNWEFILNEKSKSLEQGESLPVEEAMDIADSHFNQELDEGLEELNCWLAKAEEELDACPSMAPLSRMQDGLSRLKVMLKQVDGERDKLSSINCSLEDSRSPLADKLKAVNERWDRITEALTKRVSDIEKCIEMQRQFEEETSGLRSWLSEVEVFLEAEEAAVGDIETLQAQLEQSNALQDDIETLKNNVISIGVTARHIQSVGDAELKESVSTQLASLTDRWENAIVKAAQQNASLKDALQKSRKVWKALEELNSWLDSTETENTANNTIETTSELNASLSILTKVKNSLDDRVDELEDLNLLGKEMMTIEKAQQYSELPQMLDSLNDRWKNISTEINVRYELLKTCKENYENFKKLSADESKWLDQLEEKLEKSRLKTTDAEEISEALYDLDEFLRSHSDDLEKAQKIGESLTSSGVMTVAVQNTIHNLSSRFDHLSSKAHEEQQRLEGGAEEAQDLEREYVSVLENLSSSLMLLDQVPKEIQLSEIENQLITHQEVLQKMEQRIEAYRNQGKTQAAQRLQDQLTHLVKQYDEVEERIKLIQQSKDFDQNLASISRQLSEINEKCKEYNVKSIEPEHLESQLNRCMEIYRSLSLLKSNVEGVIATGRKIVKEGLTPDPESLTLQLDQLKSLYNQLGGSVTEQRCRLELGVKQSRKAEKEVCQLEEWLNITEKELDLREASHPVKNYQQELDFAQHAYDDVMRKKPVLTSTKENVSSLMNLFGGELTADFQERVQDQILVWERVQKRLTNRIAYLKTDQCAKASEAPQFVIELGEIQSWLEKTENSLSKFDELSPSGKESVLRNIATEIEEYKTRIEETKESSEGDISQEIELNYRIEPEISGIKRRLEHISSLIKRKETPKDEALIPKEENVESFLNRVSHMVDKISVLRDKGDILPKYTEVQIFAEEFEQGICQLEPDVATLISKGDTLTLKTHMSDVPKANAIRLAVNNLRRSWIDLKERGEILRSEAEQVKNEVREAPMKAKSLIHWLDETSKKLDMANNVEKHIKMLENEISEKKDEIEKLNSVGEFLRRYKYEELQPMLTLINIRWADINIHLSQYQKVGVSKKSFGDGEESKLKDPISVIPDFLASVNRIREIISSISRQMNSDTLRARKYEKLSAKEEELKNIKKELERLKPKVDNIEAERLNTLKKANQYQMDQVRRVIDKLREEWAQVNRGYTDKYEQWVHSRETIGNLHKSLEDFSYWLDTVEEKARSSTHQSRQEAKYTQKELEKQVTLKHRLSQSLQTLVREVAAELPSDESKSLQERVEDLLKRWKSLLLDLAARREKIASEGAPKERKGDSLDTIVTWIDQGFALIDSAVNVTDETKLSAHTAAVNNHLTHLDAKLKLFNHIKNSSSSSVSPHDLQEVDKNLMKIARSLPEYKEKLETKLKVVHMLVVDADELYKWIEDTRVKIALRDMTLEELKQYRDLLREKSAMYETLDNTFWALSQDAESKGLQVSEELKSRMNSIEARLKTLETQFSTTELLTTLNQQQRTEQKTFVTSSVSSSMTPSSVSMVTSTTPFSSVNNVVSTLTTTSVQNAVKVEEIPLRRDSIELPPAPFPKTTDASSPTLILAALDKSILQIRDWLTLMQQMSTQQKAIVGDSDNIRKLTEKQKSVLRELESKKPQLDELVASANTLKEDEDRTQLHQQVSKLREHWDETNSSVLARKTQLDAMLNDTHKFDSKRLELETWLSRMEARLERMHPIARAPDLIDQQMREQKAFHAEVNQYKHHIDLFMQMIGRLSTIYQNDDTRRLKNASEALNQRFNNLNANIISRGKTLYSAMNSSHNLSKALEKFISWLSEAESTVSAIEMEVDKIPPSSSGTGRRDSSFMRAPFVRLKDLQSEIESHKDVFASLNATGQKLLGTLENQDEALLLHRRLGEMNHRWNTLKYKSIAIRNRLEGTAENWSSLLLSLRELIEWVIRKDTELSALGPLVGDVKLLAKYENDLAIFRRGLDEKQPVIESNLKSGRQLIASEPPLSDTSDSEAGRDVDGDARYRGEENTRDLTRSVRREVAKLSEKWAALWERAANLASQVSLAHKKLGVLFKTVEEVGSRLEESEKVVSTWGPLPQDQNLADQYVHNIRKFRETLPDLQRGVDDVNDQAARFSAHNVPLTPANSAALHDINSRWKNLETAVNDRWRQVAGRSREVTPLTPAQLASSVSPPWERATATNKVPYYINHAQETTHWDHPQMMDLLDSLSEFNHIKFSAYRTATKLRSLQKKLSLDRAKLQMVTDVFDEHGLRGQNDRLIDVNDMIVVLSTLYGRISSDNNDVNTTLATDLCLNWLLNVYDSQRTGQMRVLSFRVGLICLCRGHLEEKYRYMFRLIADPNRLVDQRKLGLLLHDCVQVPRQLGEVAAFGGSNIEPSVRSCFTKAGKDRETIEAVHFLTWVQQEPQSLVWLAVLHRVAASESVQHQVKCNICKTYPIVGLRYRCLKCLSFDMCQRCFFEGRSTKSHKITHPMHEYCTATTAGDEMKDFTKALKNKFKSKRSLQKHTKKGYLPVQTVLEGDPLESPSPSPSHNVSSQDMHSRLELYASRLAEVELRTNSNSTPDSEDEHGLIAQYCQSLSSTDAPFPVPKSPLQIMASVDADQKDELEQMIKDLEEENRALQAEYERLKSEQPTGSVSEDGMGQRSEAEMLAEAKLLREHKERLEARMSILEDHNRQLEAQLQRLRQLLVEQQTGMGSPNKSSTLQTKSVTASQLAMDSPGKINGHATQGDPEKPVGSPITSVSREKENGSHSDDVEDQSDENDYDNTISPVPVISE